MQMGDVSLLMETIIGPFISSEPASLPAPSHSPMNRRVELERLTGFTTLGRQTGRPPADAQRKQGP